MIGVILSYLLLALRYVNVKVNNDLVEWNQNCGCDWRMSMMTRIKIWIDPSLTHQTTKPKQETTKQNKGKRHIKTWDTSKATPSDFVKSFLQKNTIYHLVLPPRLVWHVMQREKQSIHEQWGHCASQSIMWAFYILSPFLHVGTSLSDTRLKIWLSCWIFGDGIWPIDWFYLFCLACFICSAPCSVEDAGIYQLRGGFGLPTHYDWQSTAPLIRYYTYKKCVNIPSSS